MYALAYLTPINMKGTIKKAIHDAVKSIIVEEGGSITPTTDNPHVDLDLYGEVVDHEVVGMELNVYGDVIVITIHNGERDVDEYTTFGNDEMVKIAELFY